MAEVVLKDGSKRSFADGCTLGEAVAQISNSLAKKVLVAKVNGNVTDLRMPLVNGSEVEFLTFDSQEGKNTLRHTASHIMAQAVRRLFKDVKIAIGPAIETAFTMISIRNIVLRKTILPQSKRKCIRLSKKICPLRMK